VGNKAQVDSLLRWLRGWNDKQPQKCALVTGPTGCGKTVLVKLALREAGFAAPACFSSISKRTKKTLAEAGEAFRSRSVVSLLARHAPPAKRIKTADKPGAIVIEDVDTCDQGGLPQVASLIRKSRVPVVCTAGDGYNKRMKAVGSLCFAVRLLRPMLEQVQSFLVRVAQLERIPLPTAEARSLAAACNCNVRHALVELGMVAIDKRLGVAVQTKKPQLQADLLCDRELGAFDVVPRLFLQRTARPPGFAQETARLYHSDRGLVPLMVAENYLRAGRPAIAVAANYVSLGDVRDRAIFSTGNWGLSDVHALMSVTIPAAVVGGPLTARAEFPALLGRISTTNKNRRLAAQLASRARPGMSSGTFAAEMLPFLRDRFVGGLAAAPSSAKALRDSMRCYALTREDWDTLAAFAPLGQKPPAVAAAAKSALTRAFGGRAKVQKGTKKTGKEKEEKEEEEEEEEDGPAEGAFGDL